MGYWEKEALTSQIVAPGEDQGLQLLKACRVAPLNWQCARQQRQLQP